MSSSHPQGAPKTPPPMLPASSPSAARHADEGLATLSPAEQATRLAAIAAQSSSARCPLIPGFQIVAELGRGGMGVVYKATHVTLKRECALKMILSGEFASPEDCQRLVKEAEVFAKLDHPNIVQIFDVGECAGFPYLALELVGGGTLADLLRQRPMPHHEAARMVGTLARAVQYAHDHAVVHRDLKPGNVLVTSDGQLKITDFGLAKSEGSGLTGSGVILGTPSHVAPEQAAGKSKAAGPPADVYALGAILYEMLAGRPPFVGETPLDVILQVAGTPPPPLRLTGAKNALDLEAVGQKCLEKVPEHRYESAGELAEDLQRWLDGQETIARPLGRIARLGRTVRRNAKLLALGVPVIALAGAVVYLALQPKPAPVVPAVPGSSPEHEAFLQQVHDEVLREVNKLRKREPKVIRGPHPSTTIQRALTRQDRSAFEVLEDRRVWDLRLWRPVPTDRRTEYVSAVCLSDRQRIKKIKPVDEYRGEARTSGLVAFIEPASSSRPFRIVAQQEQEFVGAEQMKARQFILDIGDVPVDQEFEVRTETTFWNNLQNDKDRWLGVIGYSGSFKVSMLFIFPSDRPVGDFRLLVAPAGKTRQDPIPYTGRKTLIVGPNRDYLYWDVREPKANRVYIVHWKW